MLADLRFWRARMLYLETAPGSGVFHRRGPAAPSVPRFLALMARRGLRGFVRRNCGPQVKE
jgi:hypothetical protein